MIIPGPVGNIEAILEQAADQRATEVAILCHPHPRYGGSMHDAVIDAVAAPIRAAHIDTLRFNFRGVGASEGAHDQGNGEVDDLLAVVHHARTTLGYTAVTMAGYSFGSQIVWRSATKAAPTRLILVAPPMPAMPFDPDLASGCPVLAIAGDQDDYVDQPTLDQWAGKTGATLRLLPGANHFFGPQTGDVTTATGHWLSTH